MVLCQPVFLCTMWQPVGARNGCLTPGTRVKVVVGCHVVLGIEHWSSERAASVPLTAELSPQFLISSHPSFTLGVWVAQGYLYCDSPASAPQVLAYRCGGSQCSLLLSFFCSCFSVGPLNVVTSQAVFLDLLFLLCCLVNVTCEWLHLLLPLHAVTSPPCRYSPGFLTQPPPVVQMLLTLSHYCLHASSASLV